MNAHQSARTRLSAATLCGLLLALAVPLLPLLLNSDYRGVVPTAAQIEWGLGLHWLNLAALMAVVLFWERLGLASIGLGTFRWFSVLLGAVAGVAITALSGLAVNALHLNVDARFAQNLIALPLGLRVLLVLTAGIFEETLFRGYAIDRLTRLTGSRWFAGAVTWAAFVAGHAPAVGLESLAPIAIVSALITLLYLWRRDLVLNMVAHSVFDGMGLLIAPLLAQAAMSDG